MTKLTTIQADITHLSVDAIVNAANTSLLGGGGVDGAIHRAGGPAILQACRQIRNRQGGCPTGEAVITTGGMLPAKSVIHTVGPVWQGGKNNEHNLLHNAYFNALKLTTQHPIKKIAFPNISTGIYGFPKPQAATLAVNAAKSFIIQHPGTLEEIIFVCWDSENYKLYQQLLA